MTKQLTPEARARLEANAQGFDIVGLKPGESFDPIGDLDRAIAQLERQEAARLRRIRLRSVDPNTEPFTYATVVIYDVAADGTLTPHFPPGTSTRDRAEFEAFRTEAEVRAVYTSHASFYFWDHEGDPDPSGS